MTLFTIDHCRPDERVRLESLCAGDWFHSGGKLHVRLGTDTGAGFPRTVCVTTGREEVRDGGQLVKPVARVRLEVSE